MGEFKKYKYKLENKCNKLFIRWQNIWGRKKDIDIEDTELKDIDNKLNEMKRYIEKLNKKYKQYHKKYIKNEKSIFK